MLDNLEYGPRELEAQKEAHAFKFADKVVVNFQCSVRLDIRDGECPVRYFSIGISYNDFDTQISAVLESHLSYQRLCFTMRYQ